MLKSKSDRATEPTMNNRIDNRKSIYEYALKLTAWSNGASRPPLDQGFPPVNPPHPQ